MSVMNIKRSTQAFSKAETGVPSKSDGLRASDAQEFQKAYGDQQLGDIANKIADPNWVDPTKKVRTTGNPQMDKDAFLKLMLAQMKHQDPTNPMQSHEMAAQLAQFTSLEQLNNIHTTLESMNKSQAPQSNYQALALIGKKVSGDASKLSRAAGDTKHGVSFELMGDASKVKVTVKDSAGNVVRKLDVTDLKKGRNSLEWNGLGEDGLPARPGDYRIAVEAASNTGKKVFAKTAFEGRITGLNYTPEGPVLLVGNSSIKLSDVRKIEEPGPDDVIAPANTPGGVKNLDLKLGATGKAVSPGVAGLTAAQAVPPAQALQEKYMPLAQSSSPSPIQATKAAKEEEFVPPAEEPTEPTGNIDSVPMAGQLLSQIAKEVR